MSDNDKTVGSVVITGDLAARTLNVLRNQMQVFGADEATASVCSDIETSVDVCGATELVEERMSQLEELQEERTVNLLDLQKKSRVVMRLDMVIRDQDLREYGGLPEVTAFGPMETTSRACTKSPYDLAPGAEQHTRITYMVIGQVDHDVLELMAPAVHERERLETLFDIELTSPYWACAFPPKKTIQLI